MASKIVLLTAAGRGTQRSCKLWQGQDGDLALAGTFRDEGAAAFGG